MEKKLIKLGDIVTYKRNGSYGHYTGMVVSINKRVRLHLLTWCGSPVKEKWFVNVSVKRINYGAAII